MHTGFEGELHPDFMDAHAGLASCHGRFRDATAHASNVIDTIRE